jgi:hypothetical protein
MNHQKLFNPASSGAFTLAAVLLVTMTGCVGYVDGPRAENHVVYEQDDYVYYPGYDVYYNRSRHQYAYLEGGAWYYRPAPRGVSIDVLRASPSVRMDFHDSPAHHHAEVVQKYPRNWSPPGANHAPGPRNEHGDNNENPANPIHH